MIVKDGFMFTPESISANMEKTPEGYLLCKAVTISRIGEFKYRSKDVPKVNCSTEEVLLSRSEEELFSEDTIRSFEGKPIVVGHEHFADPTNWAEIAVGIVCNVARGTGSRSQELVADLLLTKQEGIDLVESGQLREVSCGYDSDVVDDGNGKGHQVGIVGNHVALVDKARCGSTCKIKDGMMDKDTKDPAKRLRELAAAGDKKGLAAALGELLDMKVEVTSDDDGGSGEPKPEDKKEGDNPPPPDDGGKGGEPDGKKEEQKDGEGGDPSGDRLSALEALVKDLSEKVAKLSGTGDEDDPKGGNSDPDAKPAPDNEARETLKDAEEIDPGMKKPVCDSANGGYSVGLLKRIKRKAIAASGNFVDAKTLDGDALDVAFKACLAIKRSNNNPKHMGDGSMAKPKPVVDINARNKAFWANRT